MSEIVTEGSEGSAMGNETSRDSDVSASEQTGHTDTEHEAGLDRVSVPEGASEVFGDQLALAERYVDWLSGAGMERGLLGPRERPRLWDRHVLNCAAVANEIEEGAAVVDIGSGAGLPGIPLALARPDLHVTLVEPLLRRATFLSEVIEDLGIDVTVLRGRAEEKQIIAQAGDADIVTSRAVAPLAKLAGWSTPLLRTGGRMVALKGSSAAEELERDRGTLTRLGLGELGVREVCVPGAEPTFLVIGTATASRKGRGRRARGPKGAEAR